MLQLFIEKNGLNQNQNYTLNCNLMEIEMKWYNGTSSVQHFAILITVLGLIIGPFIKQGTGRLMSGLLWLPNDLS